MIVTAGTADFLLRQELEGDHAPVGGAGEAGAEPEEVTQEAPEETETPLDDPGEETPEGDAPGDEGGGTGYAPDYTFKVHDKELEFDEWLKPLVQDPETEGRVRDLLERAHGLDAVKQSRDRYAQGFQQLEQQHTQLVSQVQQAAGHVQKGDMQSFFEALQIPEDTVLRYALERIQLRNAAPEVRAAYEQQRATQQRLAMLESQNQHFQQTTAQQVQQHRHQELEIISARPEVSQAITSFDARVGKPGAFMEQVRRIGSYYWSTQGKDIGADAAVKEVMALIGATGQPPVANGIAPGAGGAAGKPGTPQNGAQRVQAKKPVIPNLAGSGHSPARKVPRSIADLRKKAAELSD